MKTSRYSMYKCTKTGKYIICDESMEVFSSWGKAESLRKLTMLRANERITQLRSKEL